MQKTLTLAKIISASALLVSLSACVSNTEVSDIEREFGREINDCAGEMSIETSVSIYSSDEKKKDGPRRETKVTCENPVMDTDGELERELKKNRK